MDGNITVRKAQNEMIALTIQPLILANVMNITTGILKKKKQHEY